MGESAVDLVYFILSVILGRATYEGLGHYSTVPHDLQTLIAWAVGLFMLIFFEKMMKPSQRFNKKKFAKMQKENEDLKEKNKQLQAQLNQINEANEKQVEKQKKEESYHFFKQENKEQKLKTI